MEDRGSPPLFWGQLSLCTVSTHQSPCSQTFLKQFHIKSKFKITQQENRDIFTIIRSVSDVYGFLQEASGENSVFYIQIKALKEVKGAATVVSRTLPTMHKNAIFSSMNKPITILALINLTTTSAVKSKRSDKKLIQVREV